MSRQCLRRRIAAMDELSREVRARNARRNAAERFVKLSRGHEQEQGSQVE